MDSFIGLLLLTLFVPNPYSSFSPFLFNIINLPEGTEKPIHCVACQMNYICSKILKGVLKQTQEEAEYLSLHCQAAQTMCFMSLT